MAKRPSKPAAARVVEVQPIPAPEAVHPAPASLNAIVGQDRALGLLRDALKSTRVHHAWIFHGPKGVGKFTAALAFAALLLDPTTQPNLGGEYEADPDGPTAMLLRAGAHPDLHVIRKELARYHEERDVREKKLTNIPIDVVRSFLLEPGMLGASVRSGARAAKVFIIDEAELLAGAAQNAVLKFLEEPPDRTVTILVTSSEESLLPTIRSRCQRLAFPALSDAAMRAWLKQASPDLPAGEAPWVLALAEGCPGVLTAALEGGLVAWHAQLAPMLDNAGKGRYEVALGPVMADLTESWAKAWVESHTNASKEAANRAAAAWMFRVLSLHWRQALRGRGEPEANLRRLDAIREAEREAHANVNPLFVFEKLSSEFAAAGA